MKSTIQVQVRRIADFHQGDLKHHLGGALNNIRVPEMF